jgi:hypothetical protein
LELTHRHAHRPWSVHATRAYLALTQNFRIVVEFEIKARMANLFPRAMPEPFPYREVSAYVYVSAHDIRWVKLFELVHVPIFVVAVRVIFDI